MSSIKYEAYRVILYVLLLHLSEDQISSSALHSQTPSICAYLSEWQPNFHLLKRLGKITVTNLMKSNIKFHS
jgi:hypothetical protein